MNLSLEDILTDLIQKKDFDASLANAMQKVKSTEIDRMAVGIYQGRVVLFYNPEYLRKTFHANVVFSLKHEMTHVIWDHIPRYLEFLSRSSDEDRIKAKMSFQMAADCADNCMVRQDKKLWEKVKHVPRATPEAVSEKLGLMLEPDQSLEHYLNAIMAATTVTECGEGDGSHVFWIQMGKKEEGDGGDAEKLSTEELKGLAHLLRAQVKQMLRRVKTDHEKRHGTMSAGLREWLDQYLTDPVIPWWEQLSNYVASKRLNKMRRSVQRPSRPLLALAQEDSRILPSIGRLVDARFRIFYMEDHSGSMQLPERSILRTEFQSLLNVDDETEIRLMMGDVGVHFDQVFTTGDDITWESVGRGGTDFNSYFEYMWRYMDNDETVPDLVIVGTDAQCSPLNPALYFPPEVPVLWLVTAEEGDRWLQQLRNIGYGDVLVASRAHRAMWKQAA